MRFWPPKSTRGEARGEDHVTIEGAPTRGMQGALITSQTLLCQPGRRWRRAEARIQGGGGAKADGIRVVLDAGRRRTLTNLPRAEAAMALLQVAAVREAAKFREGE